MEINKVDKNFFQMSQSEIKNTQNNDSETITQNINIETSSDEEVILNEISNVESVNPTSDIKSIDDVTVNDNSIENNNIQVQNLSSMQTSEIKTLEEYKGIADNMYSELYEKFNGDDEQINQYIANNMREYADIDGDGRITLIDTEIWTQISSSISSKDDKDKRQSLSKISYALKQSTGINKNQELLDLNDLENLFSICGSWRNCKVATCIKSSLDLSKIAQTENWEERLDCLSEEYGINGNLPCFQGDVKSNIKSYSEYAKNNPDNIQYCAIAEAYKNMQKTLSERDLWAEAKTAWEWNQENLPKDCADRNYTITAIYNQLYDQIYGGATSSAINKDINGDGKVTATDIASFSTDIDLDGDGVVSNEEKKFLKKAKENMKSTFYRTSASKNYYNLSTIDDIVSSVEVYDEKYTDKLKEQKPSYAAVNFDTGEFEAIEFDDDDIPGQIIATGYLNSLGSFGFVCHGLQDGTAPITSAQEIRTCTASRLYEIYKEAVDYLSPANLYLHYVPNADLSKEELEEILSKINNASASAQTQLVEVKAAVKERLAILEE